MLSTGEKKNQVNEIKEKYHLIQSPTNKGAIDIRTIVIVLVILVRLHLLKGCTCFL